MDRDREYAIEIFKNCNDSESLFHHALAVEAVMRAFAEKFDEDKDYWGCVGLLHDVDYEMYPEEHCIKAVEILERAGYDEDFIHAVCSHGYGLCVDVKPELVMEKVLYTIDELTGLVNACALMRPEKMNGMSVKSVKKKWNAPSFAAGVNRQVIADGAEMLGLELSEIIQITIDAMRENASSLGL